MGNLSPDQTTELQKPQQPITTTIIGNEFYDELYTLERALHGYRKILNDVRSTPSSTPLSFWGARHQTTCVQDPKWPKWTHPDGLLRSHVTLFCPSYFLVLLWLVQSLTFAFVGRQKRLFESS